MANIQLLKRKHLNTFEEMFVKKPCIPKFNVLGFKIMLRLTSKSKFMYGYTNLHNH